MRAFKEIEVAEVWAPFEIVDWLYLGRVPEAERNQLGDEMRSSIQSLVMGRDKIFAVGLSQRELASHGVVVDVGHYWKACAEVPFLESSGPHVEANPDTHSLGSATQASDYASLKSILDDVDVALSPAKDRAQMAVIVALMSGELSAYGYRAPKGWSFEDGAPINLRRSFNDDWRDLFTRAKVEKIPVSIWRKSPEVWRYGTLGRGPSGFLGCWIETAEILKLFPIIQNLGSPLTLQSVGDYAFETKAKKTTAQGRPLGARGRPAIGEGMLQRFIDVEFKRRRAEGKLPFKKEAIISECMVWCLESLGQEIARSTAQRYLADMFAQK